MPKQAALGKTKVNAFIREFRNEFISTPTDELFCKLCEKVVKHDKRFDVDQHRNGSVHQAKLTIPTTSRQSFISTPNIPNFNETVVKTFLGANISLKKLRHPAIRRLFIDMGNPLPSESTSRRIVENITKEEENQMIYNFTNKDIFIVIDEAEVDGKKYLNILGGHVENPAHTVALESIILQSAPNQTTIVQHIDGCIRKLPIERKNFVLLLSDSASYMIAAGRALKLLYNNLFHVVCVAHLLHNCAEKFRNKYKNTDLLISSLKAATVKNPSRRNLFHEIGTPPQPVITRWGTWLDAAVNYFAEKLPQIRDHRAIPWRWPNCHQSKTCCPIARTWVGIDRNMPQLQIAIKFNWTHTGYELQHNASVPGSTCTSVSRGSLFNFRIHIESFTWKGFSRHNQLHSWKHNSRQVFSITTMLCDKLCGREKFFAAEKTAVEGEEFSTGQFKEIFHILL